MVIEKKKLYIMDVYKYLQENFKLITREDYRSFDLSNNAKKILCDIGLPYEPLNFIRLNIDEIKNIKLDDEYVIIGNDFGTNICINNKDEIFSIDSKKEYPKRFINKNLESFLKFIVIFLLHKKEIDEADDDEINSIIQKIRTEFNEIDIQALSSAENWWSIILEQIDDF